MHIAARQSHIKILINVISSVVYGKNLTKIYGKNPIKICDKNPLKIRDKNLYITKTFFTFNNTKTFIL
jgi:hypothetical protein